MSQSAIFGPFFATIFLTLLVWIYMYVRRFYLYLIATLAVWFIAIRAALAYLQG
jgi:hypothetical protein